MQEIADLKEVNERMQVKIQTQQEEIDQLNQARLAQEEKISKEPDWKAMYEKEKADGQRDRELVNSFREGPFALWIAQQSHTSTR